MQRNTLVLFLGSLAAIIIFSGAAGVASVFWKAPEDAAEKSATSGETKKKPAKSETASPNSRAAEEDDEDEDKPKNVRNGTNKNGTLTGRVTDLDSGKPLAGATVRIGWHNEYIETTRDQNGVAIEKTSESRRKKSPQSVQTDADGHFTIEVPPSWGMVNIHFSEKRHAEQTLRVAFDGTETAEAKLAPVPCLFIIVQDKDGNRLSKFDLESEKRSFFDRTTHQESFELKPGEDAVLTPSLGTWVLTAKVGNRASKPEKVSVGKTDQTVTLTLEGTK